ncbi:MAG: hypothetical protein ACREGC_02825 [Minisyncoccia bacterium]
MGFRKQRSVEIIISRLTREISDIDEYLYVSASTKDRDLYAGMLERKRDDIVRAGVLQMHTAIEDLLNDLIIDFILNTESTKRSRKLSTKTGGAVGELLIGNRSIGFESKLNLAVGLKIISPKLKEKLKRLNTSRNRCSHNWLLNTAIRRGKKPKMKKPPLLNFHGKNLHKVEVFKEFLNEFGAIYTRLFLKMVG